MSTFEHTAILTHLHSAKQILTLSRRGPYPGCAGAGRPGWRGAALATSPPPTPATGGEWKCTILSMLGERRYNPTIHWNYTVSQNQINMGFAGWVEPVFANLETLSLKMPNQIISRPIPETALPCPGERRTRWWGLSRRTPWPQTRPILRLSGWNFKFWGRKMITQRYISEEIPQIKMNFIFDRPWRDGRCKMCKIRQITFQVLSKAVLKYIFVVGSTPWF